MIIETPYKNGDTVSMKLTSGEEVVARLEEDKEDVLKVTKPLMLTGTQEGIGLAPFMFTIDPEATVNLNKSNILCVLRTEENMANQYIQNTTGLSV